MFSIIAAYDETKAIGKDNQLLWHIAEDLAFFKETTLNHTLIMGRKTFESIGKPLPKRKTIVLSQKQLQIDGVEVCTFDEVYSRYKESDEEIFICGGAEIYQLFLPYTQKLYISHVVGRHEADTYFPKWDESEYVKIETRKLCDRVRMVQYERKL
ncbi:MAG: dihydrofolate reductase [Culicoidibacterales bacterium]